MSWQRWRERCIEGVIRACGISSIAIVTLIFLFLLKEGLALFHTASVAAFLGGDRWYPISEPPRFGILPLILGSIWVTVGAALLSVPVGIGSALFVSEIARG